MKIDKGLMGGSSTLLVLSLLAEKDCYGYEVIRTLEERSDKTFLYSEARCIRFCTSWRVRAGCVRTKNGPRSGVNASIMR